MLRVLALPVSGRGQLVERFRFTAAAGETPTAELRASGSTAALLVRTARRNASTGTTQVFAGPVSGPFRALGPPGVAAAGGPITLSVQVGDDRVFTAQRIGTEPATARIMVHEPGAAPVAVALPPDVPLLDVPGVRFAGDFVAYALPVPGHPDSLIPRRLVVQNWRTGAPHSSLVVNAGVAALDLLPDGRVVFAEGRRRSPGGGFAPGVISMMEPGARTATRVAARGGTPRFAGSRIVFVRGDGLQSADRLMVAAPSRPPRPFGVPTAGIGSLVTNSRRVLWTANDCVLTAPLTARAASAPAAGPCPRSEVLLEGDGRLRIGRDRRTTLPLRCIAAPPPGCRGTVRVFGEDSPRTAGYVRFRIPRGARGVTIRLNREGYRFVRRDELDGGAVLVIRATVVDPAGRRSTLESGVGIDIAS